MSASRLAGLQQLALVLLRTLIGWHLAWEGFLKLWWPSWSRGGWPLPRWSAAGSLQAATGPLADHFHALGAWAWMPLVDGLLAVGLLLAGLSLMLGLFTQTGTLVALVLLLLGYLAHVPTLGVAGPGAEGNYLFVNKNLVEVAALLVLLVFRTGRIAGLDLLLADRRRRRARETARSTAPTEATS